MTRFVKSAVYLTHKQLGHDTASFLFSVLTVLVSALLGYGLAVLYLPTQGALSLASADPYAGCSLFAEYAIRAAKICRPVLFETSIIWISAYVDFEKPLLVAVFALRGLSLGASMCALMLSEETSALAFFPLAYMAVTAVFLILTRYLRCDIGRVSLSQSSVYALLAGGIASAITIAVTMPLT